MSAGWWIRRLDELPRVPPEDEHDPDWYPLQHYFGLTTVGVNAYVARASGDVLVEAHDETGSGHEELYFIAAGSASFTVDGEERDVGAGTVVVVREPAVRRQAVAREPGTTVIAVGGRPDPGFVSSWQPHHFEGIPRAE